MSPTHGGAAFQVVAKLLAPIKQFQKKKKKKKKSERCGGNSIGLYPCY